MMISKCMLAMLVLACLLIVVAPFIAHVAAHNVETCRTRAAQLCGPSAISFYVHNTVYNPDVNNTNFNSVYGLPPNVSFANAFAFGTPSTFEAPITIGPSNTSEQIGVANGLWQLNGRTEFILFFIFTANITQGDYKGTIDIFGQIREINPIRYLSVIGGTDDFLGARGLASNTLVEIVRTPPARFTLSFDLDLYY